MSLLLTYILLVVQVHGLQFQKLNDLHAHRPCTQIYFKSEEKVATTMSSAWLKTEKKKQNEITFINLLYNVLLVEPIFGSLGLIKSSEPAFEDKLASMKSLVSSTTTEVAIPPNVVSVTTEPPKFKKSPKMISESDSIIASSVSNKGSKIKKTDFKDEVWVVRKLKEIRARENEVIIAATKPSPVTTPIVTTSAAVVSSTTNTNRKISTVSVPTKSTSDTTTATTATSMSSTATIASSTSSTPISISAPIPVPTIKVTSAPTTTVLLQNAVSSALSSFMPTLSSSENKPKLESTAPAVVATNVPIINNEKTTVLLAPKPAKIEQEVTKSTVEEKPETSDLFFPLDMDQIGKSVINQGVEYGPVDKLATEFSINSDTFKLPKISIEMETSAEFLNAKNVIKTAGLSGTIAYALSEVGFWAISVPIIVSSYHSSTNEWLDINNPTDRTIIFGLSAGFTSAARLALPLRIAIAAGLTPLVDRFITKPFILKEDFNDINGVNKNIVNTINSKTATIITIPKPDSNKTATSIKPTTEQQGLRSRVVGVMTSPFRIVKDRFTRQQTK